MSEPFAEFAWTMLEPGTSVIVGAGPLQGLRGTVLGVDERNRVIVTVMLMRGITPVALEPSALSVDDRFTEPQPTKH